MIVVDIDGVIADSEPWIVKGIEELSGIKLKFGDPRLYDFFINTDINIKDGLKYIDESLIKYVDDIKVYNHVRTSIALRKIQSREGCVNFVTARSNGLVNESTDYWLRKNFTGLYYKLHSLGHYVDKFKWMFLNSANAIVEDRFKTVNSIPNCYIPYLVNRDWNEGRIPEPHVIRVFDLLAAVNDYFDKKG